MHVCKKQIQVMEERPECDRRRSSKHNKRICIDGDLDTRPTKHPQLSEDYSILYIRGEISDTSNGEAKYDTDNGMDQSSESFEQMQGLQTSLENWKIFLTKKSFTEEEDNYLRVCLLLLNIGTPALHKKFAEAFSKVTPEGMDRNATLHEIFNHKDYRKILNDLQEKRLITESNRCFLQSSDQVDNGQLYDIKLMAVLLIEFESKRIIKLDDTKKYIQVIHKQRNNIAHKTTPTLSNDELITFWKTITEAIQQLGGNSFERECYTLRNATPNRTNTIIHQNIKDILNFISDLESEDSKYSRENDGSYSTTEQQNFVRLCSLLIQIAPKAVRFKFKKEFSEELYANLKRNEGLKDEDNIDNCSLSSMLILLKRKFRILDDKLPNPFEISTDADLTRINYYTTLISDEKIPRSLTTTDFEDIWKTVAGAISRLGDVKMEWQCEGLKNEFIDEIKTERILGLIEVQKEIIVVQKLKDKLTTNLAEIEDPLEGKKREVEEWVEEDKRFVETRSSDLLLSCLRDEHITSITVVGSFGVGKSFTTRHVSLILKNEGYRILPVSTVHKIREFDDVEIRTVFIVDDFCGRNSVDQRMHNIKKLRSMPEVLLESKSKIIVCCTPMVYQHYSFKALSYFCSCVIDIDLDKVEFSGSYSSHKNFSSHKNYSKLNSVLSNVHNRAKRLFRFCVQGLW